MTRTNDEARDIFRQYGNVNIITPNVIEYGWCGEYPYEVSTGTFMGITGYGLTFLSPEGGWLDPDDGGDHPQSGPYFSDAEVYDALAEAKRLYGTD